MKKIILLFLIVLATALFVLFSSANFYMGSNSKYFITPFDYVGSQWYCSEFDIEGQVYADEYIYMILKTDSGQKYTILSLNDTKAELYNGDIMLCNSSAIPTEPLCITTIKSKKRLGKVNQFEIEKLIINSQIIEHAVFNKVG